jgi:two-component system, OmpR family, sensor histidine kinase KdpD
MTRLEAGTVQLRREPASIEDVVGQAASQVRETISERRPNIDIPPDLPPVMIDGVLMSHALANVLENAAKYSAPDSPIEVQAQAANGHVTIAVCDRGIGIPAEDLGRIFEKFYRRDEAHSVSWPSCGSGTGLGLAIAKGIVEAHGGRIWAEQRVQGGVIVSLRLPLEVQS